ncbi:MAG: hypothetical protein SFV51_22450 [Bryobacteraceae bacterium]|nr:hypothetical protein [Bryobacteraceae bacterium]
MNNTHPSDDQLLRYADGELAASEAGVVRKHLEACWQCRAELEGVQKVISGCVAYRKTVLEELPAPPRPWADLYSRMAEVDAAGRQSFGSRIAAALRMPAMRRWAPVAAALTVVLLLNQQLRITPSAQAAELLRQAVAASEARPAAAKRIRIRTRSKTLVRTVNSGARPTPIEARFAAAHYDWQDPLSARAFQQWRDQLPARQDEVAESGGAFRIHTTAATGDLAEATLALRGSDLHPLEGTFRFRDNEIVEITELPAEPAPAGEIAVAAPSSVRETPAPVPAPPPAASGATTSDELRVLAALQAIGADLGEAVEVSRSNSRIEVRGLGIDPTRQQQIAAALSGMAAGLQFTDAVPAVAVAERTQAVASASASELQDRFAEKLGGRAQLDQLASAALNQSEAAMARLYAMRRLAARFPESAALSAADRATVLRLLGEHARELASHAAALERQLAPSLASLGAIAAPPDVNPPSSWQDATEQLFVTARRAERLLAALFGGAPPEISAEAVPSQLLRAVTELKSRAEACQRLLRQ